MFLFSAYPRDGETISASGQANDSDATLYAQFKTSPTLPARLNLTLKALPHQIGNQPPSTITFHIDTSPHAGEDFLVASPDFLTITEQVADHLRSELLRGSWRGTMPGMNYFAPKLGVNTKTVEAALRRLERDGLLATQGPGRRRRIIVAANPTLPTLRIAILDYEPLAQTEDWCISMQQQLMDGKHSAFFTEKSLIELGNDVRRVERLVKRTHADAWVICSGSREVLTWFAEQKAPAFALFGRRKGLPIAGIGPDKETACRVATRRLIALGHQRIVVLVRESQRTGGPAPSLRTIFEEMTEHGLPVSSYNLPDWDDTSDGFHRCLDQLFRVTPPTALIVDEPFLFHAAKDHLAQCGMLAPAHVSLICTDPDPTFAWCKPSIAHIRWDYRPVVRRVARWTNNIASGKEDRRQSFTKAEFVAGGTIGPNPSAPP